MHISNYTVSNYVKYFCCEQHRCQCADGVTSEETIATKSLKYLSQRKSSGFFLIKFPFKIIFKIRSHDQQGPYVFFSQELLNVSFC